MDPAAARALFAAARVAHLATADLTGQPHLVPITFAVDGDRTYFAVDHKPKRSLRLKRLANIAANPRVSLLVDHYSDTWEHLWWVRADGLAAVVADEQDRQEALDRLAGRYPQYRDRRPTGPVVAVEVTAWSGWAANPGRSTP